MTTQFMELGGMSLTGLKDDWRCNFSYFICSKF